MADVQLSSQATRVEDYLNDKLQTAADLEGLDILLENVQTQQALLKQQLLEAEKDLAESTKASEAHSSALLQQARAFKKQQADVDRRLLIVTRSETSDDAVQKFDADIKALQQLDIATGYVELLSEVEDLSTEARRNFNSSPRAALQPYLRLQKLAIALKEAQPAAEDAAPHLVDHVEKTAQHLWKQIKDTFAGEFEKILTRMKWPGKDVTLAGSLEHDWTGGVEKLLELQSPYVPPRISFLFDMKHPEHSVSVGEILSKTRLTSSSELDTQSDHVKPSEEPLVLLPLEVMVKPLDQRFQYHFSGDRPTNKLDKVG
ncbi:MAG: hypothetical protein Q9213_006130 [Squamulea squamosa]